jgi:hypothetical protein
VPLSTRDNTITAVYNSTLEGSLLGLSCRDAITAVCSADGMWTPDPNMHTCKSITSDSDSSGRCYKKLIFMSSIVFCIFNCRKFSTANDG